MLPEIAPGWLFLFPVQPPTLLSWLFLEALFKYATCSLRQRHHSSSSSGIPSVLFIQEMLCCELTQGAMARRLNLRTRFPGGVVAVVFICFVLLTQIKWDLRGYITF